MATPKTKRTTSSVAGAADRRSAPRGCCAASFCEPLLIEVLDYIGAPKRTDKGELTIFGRYCEVMKGNYRVKRQADMAHAFVVQCAESGTQKATDLLVAIRKQHNEQVSRP